MSVIIRSLPQFCHCCHHQYRHHHYHCHLHHHHHHYHCHHHHHHHCHHHDHQHAVTVVLNKRPAAETVVESEMVIRSGPPRAQAEEDTLSVQQRQSGLRSVAATEKRLSPEAPPPSTEGRPRLPHGPRQTSPQKSHTPNPLKVDPRHLPSPSCYLITT